jgi:hypothetical protein
MRHQINDHPVRTLAVLLVLAFGFFNLSAAGQPGTDWENGPAWVGNPSWFLFLACALAFIVIGVLTVVRVVRGRTR